MRVLVACEFSGVVRDAFRRRGHDAWSCDLRDCEDKSEWHIIGDALDAAWNLPWELMIAHPPCTYLSRSGARWWNIPGRESLAKDAAAFAIALASAPIRMIAVENPVGLLHKLWRWPDQRIQPYDFGEPFSKATCLWLKNLPPLMSTLRIANYRPLIRANVTARNRQGKEQTGILSGGEKSAKTFPGIADAMAEQWGCLGAMECVA